MLPYYIQAYRVGSIANPSCLPAASQTSARRLDLLNFREPRTAYSNADFSKANPLSISSLPGLRRHFN
ncbi:hypothetical protein ACFLV7_12700, partial [Chloroflexota bacterium]